jgi:hypothetical protein
MVGNSHVHILSWQRIMVVGGEERGSYTKIPKADLKFKPDSFSEANDL